MKRDGREDERKREEELQGRKWKAKRRRERSKWL